MLGGAAVRHEHVSPERRQISSLFYDIVDSTGLMFSYGIETYRAAARRLHAFAQATIARYGGTAGQPQGDGGAAYFGFPTAQEDAAERAVCAALEILEGVTHPSGISMQGEPLKLRVAIATGTVVAEAHGERGGAAATFGIAPTLAARLQAHAEPNSLVVSDATHRLVGGLFRSSLFGSLTLKGFPEPVTAWRITGRTAATSRFAALRSPQAPLFGRELELHTALRISAAAAAGRGQAIVIVGEAGLGKSRLAMELCNRLINSAGVLPILQCQPLKSDVPLHPLRDRLEELPRRETDSIQPSGEQTSAAFEFCPGTQELRKALDLALSAPDDQFTDSLTSADARRRAAIRAATQLVATAATEGPVVLCCEDLHWADPTTREWLSHLQRWCADWPVLLLLTTRDWPDPVLATASNATVLQLPRLAPNIVEQIVAFHWPKDRPLPSDVVSYAQARSNGIPLFAEEIAKLLARAPGPAGPILIEELVSLRDMLKARVEHSGADPLIIQAASVLGNSFNTTALNDMMKDQADRSVVDENLRRMMEAGLIYVAEPKFDFEFSHMLVQESIYSGLIEEDRTQLHCKAFITLRSANAADAVLAAHAMRGGLAIEAILYLERAGNDALRRGGLLEARRYFEDVLKLRAHAHHFLPGALQSELMLCVKLGAIIMTLDGPGSPNARGFYERTFSQFEHAARRHPDEWFALCWGWWLTAKDWRQQRERAHFLQRRTRRHRSPSVRLHALHCSWATNFDSGRHREVLAATKEGIRLYEQELGNHSQVALSGHDAKLCALGERAQSYWMIGARQLADSDLQAAWTHERRLIHIASKAHLLDMTALVRFYEVDLNALGRVIERMRAVAKTHGLAALDAKALIFAGWLSAKRGRPRSGVEILRRGLLRLAEIGTEEDFPVYADMLAQALEAHQHYEEALAILNEAIRQAESKGHTFWLPELYRRRGTVRRRIEPSAESWGRDLHLGRDLARSQGAWWLELRCIDALISLDPAAAIRAQARRNNIERSIAALIASQACVTKCDF